MSGRRTKWIAGTRLRSMGLYYHGENWFLEGQTQRVPGITVAHSLPKHSPLSPRHHCGVQPDSVPGITVVHSLPKHNPTQLQLLILSVFNSPLGEAFLFKFLIQIPSKFSPCVITMKKQVGNTDIEGDTY